MDDKVDRNTILESGIFAFDDQNKPIGINGLKPDKDLSEKDYKIIKVPSHRLKLMAEEIAAQINSYSKEPRQFNTLQKIINAFENDLNETISRYLDTDKVEPHYSNLLKKGKKYLNSSLKKRCTKYG